MDKLIQPLSDILKRYPDDSAKVIVILSAIFSIFAGFYEFMKSQYIINLKADFDRCENERKQVLEDRDKIKQIFESEQNLIKQLREVNHEVEELKQKCFDFETQQKLKKLQVGVNQMINTIESNVKDIKKAISTQDDRRDVFKKAYKKRNKWNIPFIPFKYKK